MRTLIIIPAYNEAECLINTLQNLISSTDYDLFVVNDGSTDGTLDILKQQTFAAHDRLRYVTLPLNGGIGSAVQTGYLHAHRGGYDIAVQFDADGQHSVDSLSQLIDELSSRSLDLCIGSRFLTNADNFRSTHLRRFGIWYFSWLIFLLTGIKITDPTSGYRACSKRAIELFSQHYPDDYPEPEAILQCARSKLRIGEREVKMHERQGGTSSIGGLDSIYYMLKVTACLIFERSRKRNYL